MNVFQTLRLRIGWIDYKQIFENIEFIMEFVGDIKKLNSDPLAKLVYDKLSQIIDDNNAVLHYKFPFYKGDIREDTIEAKLLSLIPQHYSLTLFISA